MRAAVAKLPPIPPDQAAALARIAASQRKTKQLVAMRLDLDVADWLRSLGPGYTTRVNQILRSVMENGK